MAKKNKKQSAPVMPQAPRMYAEPQIVYRMVPKGIPIATPATHIQLTPIVQPVALVPYSTQAQPISMIEDDDLYDNY